ncbi:MAG: CHAT domain-containing protein, partial [bacterium]|nr:CHAT domain-containing protein [bacterium]
MAQRTKQKQIKVLAITASPDNTSNIDYEKEQETLLDAFNPFDPKTLYLDIPDPVQGTLTETQERLKTGKHDILYLIAHPSLDKKNQGALALEEENGNLDEIPAKKFAKEISNAPPLIVILSSSYSQEKELHFPAVAKALQSSGISTVIAMKRPLSPPAAQDFIKSFFTSLLQKKTVKEAFKSGTKAIADAEEPRIKENKQWRPKDEANTPQLFLTGEPISIAHFSDAPIQTTTVDTHPQLASIPKKPTADTGFIGRREILRKVFRDIKNGESVITLKGDGGVGKSAILARVASRLKQEKFETLVFRGTTSAEMVLKRISQQARKQGVKEAENIFESQVEYKEKLDKLLDHFIYKKKLLLIFEDFDENQNTDGEFLNDRLKELVSFLKETLDEKDSVMIFSTRYDIPDFTSIPVEPLTWLEFRKVVFKTELLKPLDEKSLKYFYFEMGGYPRAVHLFDEIARYEFPGESFQWSQLRGKVSGLTERVMHKESESADFSSMLLEALLGRLDKKKRRQLEILSIYKGWVPSEALAQHQQEISPKDRKDLKRLFQVHYSGKGKESGYHVPRLTAQTVRVKIGEEELKRFHLLAARYFDNPTYDEDYLESRWHYLDAHDFDKASAMTFDMDQYFCGIGYPQFAFDLVKELEKHVPDMTQNNQL